ncbi:MAG: hypothetical protein SF029_23560 [bacterium]|nr:hypothetical protein [bacterium]
MATRATVNRQVRGFAVMWTLITFVIGAATFFGIYLTYNAGGGEPSRGAVAIIATLPPTRAVALATSVPTAVQPTRPPTTEPMPTEEAAEEDAAAPADAADGEGEEAAAEDSDAEAAVAQAVEEPTVEPTATALPVEDTDYQVGIQAQLAYAPAEAELWANDVANLGLGWVKHQVRWEAIEPVQGEINEGEFGRLAMTLDADAAKGLKVLLSVVTAPDWAREPGVSVESEGPPANPQDYADFVVSLLEEFPGKIHAIEVWNEMNIDREWLSVEGLSPANYVELLLVTYEAVRAVDPGIIIVTGALSPTGGLNQGGIDRAIDDFVFLEALVNAGMLDYADCVGAHHNGYNISPSVTWDNVPEDSTAQFRGPFDNAHHSWSFRSTLQTYANIARQVDPDMRLCVTEFGWATMEGLGEGYPQNFEFALDNTLEEQAEWTIEALNNMEEWDIVWLAFIWNLNYGPQTNFDTSNDNTPYSIIGLNYSRRPVFDAIIAWNAERRESTGQ